MDFMTDLCLYVFRKHPEMQLLILPHVLAPDGADDRLAGRDLLINLKRRGVSPEKMVFPTCELLPSQARNLIGNGAFIITGRMHGSISAFCAKTPPLVLSYSRKYWGIIHEYLEMDDLIIDVRYNTWDEILRASIDKVEYIEENRQDLLERMEDKVSEMQELAMLNIDVLFEELGYVR
jgi:colanic acid/amylovoran biosynthesis protein